MNHSKENKTPKILCEGRRTCNCILPESLQNKVSLIQWAMFDKITILQVFSTKKRGKFA